MIDDSFRLTSVDVKHHDFRPARLGGYEKSSVEEFRDRVAEELERLTRANQELDAKAKGFHEQLRAYRERDKALNEALISAQQLRAETREQAEREAQLILREARAEAERVVESARGEVRRLVSEVDAIERSRRTYLAQMRSLVERQLADIEAAASARQPEPPRVSMQDEPSEERNTSHPTPAWLNSLASE